MKRLDRRNINTIGFHINDISSCLKRGKGRKYNETHV